MQRKKMITLLSILLITSIACSFGYLDNFINQALDETDGNENQISTVEGGIDNSGGDPGFELEQAQAGESVNLAQGLSDLESFHFQFKQTMIGMDESALVRRSACNRGCG